MPRFVFETLFSKSPVLKTPPWLGHPGLVNEFRAKRGGELISPALDQDGNRSIIVRLNGERLAESNDEGGL